MQNAEYVEQRNALIPSAVAHANRIAGANPQSNVERDVWNLVFHTKMNDLARPLTSGESGRIAGTAVKGRA